MPEKFIMTIPCKPYTKRFLELNYGIPVDFTQDKTVYPIFKQKLERNSTRRNNSYNEGIFRKYTTTVNLKITEDDFYNHGWELSPTETVMFNQEIEGRSKLFMYLMVSARIGFGMNLTDAVRSFQERFGFTEEIWPADSIIKDCRRNLTIHRNEVIENISALMDKLIIDKLSEKGTTFHKNKSLINKAI